MGGEAEYGFLGDGDLQDARHLLDKIVELDGFNDESAFAGIGQHLAAEVDLEFPPVEPPPAPPAPPKLELPSSAADYLNNPKPPYPPLSKRLGEQGKVVVRVLIETNGTASKAEIAQSSGFDRLDQASVNTVLKWRYVPGKRGGVPEAMWFDVPVNWVLQ